ncbi:MAG: M81 family metallopeptidase [Rikenellaceae bacterium]
MKNLSLVLLAVAAFVAVSCNAKSEKSKPRVAIVGVGIECSTFSPAVTKLEDFRPWYGEDIIKNYPFFSEDSTLRDRAEWVPTIVAWATPGGIVERECYDSLLSRSLRLLEEGMPYDGIFLDIHGAMSVVGLDDPEAHYVARIRELVGDDALISASMDPHGCVSEDLAKGIDMLTSYRMSPHTDRYISRHRAIDNLLDRLESGEGKPKYKAWVRVPILLPGEKTSTRVEPGMSLYKAIEPIEAQEGVIDAAIWMSYPWADEPRNHGVVVVTGDDKGEVEAGAMTLAQMFWDAHDKFEFVAPTATLDEVLENALKSDKKPYFISDMGDNPTAGGAGDVTWTLTQLLERKEFQLPEGKRLIYASIPGGDYVQRAIDAGIGATVTGKVGAVVDSRYAPPVELTGVVESFYEDAANPQVVIRVGSMRVIVTETRKPFHYERDFDRLSLEPRSADIIVVKLGYLTEELYDMRGDWMMAHTRGGVDQELEKLPFKRVQRPIYPLDADMEDPELYVTFL